jgi:phage-related protein
MSYYQKYIKYKNKYLELRKQNGGNLKTAKELFYSTISRNYEEVMMILIRDRNKNILNFEDKPANPFSATPFIQGYKGDDGIFDDIFKKINEIIQIDGKDNSQIDWIIKSYLKTKTFGNPTSLENYGRYEDAYKKYEILNRNKNEEHPVKPFKDINGLIELEEYISENSSRLEEINIKKEEKQRKKGIQKKIKDEGEDDKEVILETDKVIVYRPTTEKGAQYYGRQTRWCTAASQNCMFNHYNDDGHIYIIQSKTDSKDKYQLHLESDQLMNNKDEAVSIKFIIDNFNDNCLEEWLDSILLSEYYKKKEIKIDNLLKNEIIRIKPKILDLESLTLGDTFNEPLGDLLNGLTKLKVLKFGYNFNQPLCDSLKDLTKLEVLEFSEYDGEFNQPLGDSLKGLTNLKILIFGKKFNKRFGNSLKYLTNLEELKLGKQFNQQFDDSLKYLTNLKILKFDYSKEKTDFSFNRLLGDSLKYLSNLEYLNFGNNFDKPLGDSLECLINLKYLYLSGSKFNQPIGNSLNNLINLEFLDLAGDTFNQPISNSLDNLRNLKYLKLGNQSLNESLKNLTKLEDLEFKNTFDQPLGNSLKNLINIKILNFGDNFDQPLGNSLNNLINLEILSFGKKFNQPLGDSLKCLTKLEYLDLRNFNNEGLFNQPLGDSLKDLINLKELNFGDNFNQLLGDSLIYLINLEELNFGDNYKQPLGNSLDNLTKLKKINGKEYHKE